MGGERAVARCLLAEAELPRVPSHSGFCRSGRGGTARRCPRSRGARRFFRSVRCSRPPAPAPTSSNLIPGDGSHASAGQAGAAGLALPRQAAGMARRRPRCWTASAVHPATSSNSAIKADAVEAELREDACVVRRPPVAIMPRRFGRAQDGRGAWRSWRWASLSSSTRVSVGLPGSHGTASAACQAVDLGLCMERPFRDPADRAGKRRRATSRSRSGPPSRGNGSGRGWRRHSAPAIARAPRLRSSARAGR
ncbi:hypothetical protein SAMN05216276_106225 [Streptosporangium subroseum]|uniref:Uncharacterized protein n=1 Tax=Streptosporangium subroseum TaxID=106412 RepID=A0A239NLH0_9ACTN|nr:hypothetical protein SAMN05216276_106225 [Streptosporangium subroseum]